MFVLEANGFALNGIKLTCFVAVLYSFCLLESQVVLKRFRRASALSCSTKIIIL